MLYRRRGVFIDAVQFTGTNAAEVAAFAGGHDRFNVLEREDVGGYPDPQALAEVWDVEHGRWEPVRCNDWVPRKGARQTLAPISADEFAAHYEPNPERKIA